MICVIVYSSKDLEFKMRRSWSLRKWGKERARNRDEIGSQMSVMKSLWWVTPEAPHCSRGVFGSTSSQSLVLF